MEAFVLLTRTAHFELESVRDRFGCAVILLRQHRGDSFWGSRIGPTTLSLAAVRFCLGHEMTFNNQAWR